MHEHHINSSSLNDSKTCHNLTNILLVASKKEISFKYKCYKAKILDCIKTFSLINSSATAQRVEKICLN